MLTAFIFGSLVFGLLGWVWRQDYRDWKARRAFTATTERAAYVKLNERAMAQHPDMAELRALDEEWYR